MASTYIDLSSTQVVPTDVVIGSSIAVSNFPSTYDGEVTNGPGVDAVNIQDGGNSITVDGSISVSNFPATQPVSGTVNVGNFPATQNVEVTNFPATQPVSGTVAVTQSTDPWNTNISQVAGAVPSATNGLPARITNGTSFVDPTQIRTLSVTDNVTVNQTVAGALHATIDASALPTGASTSANQTNGGQKTQVVDASGNIMPSGDIAIRKVFVQPTDGTDSQDYTASGEAKVLVTPLTNSSVVKSQLQDNAGNGVTSTVVGATRSLDVNVAQSALPADAATATLQNTQVTSLNTVNSNLDAIEVLVGPVTETAPASDTASSGLNGRLQRVAQRLTSILTFFQSLSMNIGAPDANTQRVVAIQIDSAGDAPDAGTANADSLSSLITGWFGNARSYLYNGTSWDRQRSNVNALTDTTNRTAGQSVTSAAIDTLHWGTACVSLYSSHTATFTVEWSVDGSTNWRADGDTYDVTAGVLKGNSYGFKRRYMRVISVNTSGSTTTAWELTVDLKAMHTKPSSHKASEAFNDSTDLEGTKAIISGKRNDDTYGNARLTNGNLLKVAISDYVDAGPGTLANGAETAVAGTAVQVLAANSNAKRRIIQNTGAANCRIGITGVTATTGVRLTPNGVLILEYPYLETAAIFAIREGAISTTVLAQETT